MASEKPAAALSPRTPAPQTDNAEEAMERRLQELAFGFHVGIEGEYGCPGVTCPGVQRLIERLRALKGVGRFDDYQPASVSAVPPTPQWECKHSWVMSLITVPTGTGSYTKPGATRCALCGAFKPSEQFGSVVPSSAEQAK